MNRNVQYFKRYACFSGKARKREYCVILKTAVIIVACIIGIGILYFANPEYTVWMPQCLFYKLTGIQCPACGTQRALHQLLHCNFTVAFRYNPFLIISVPYLLSLIVCQFDTGNRLKKLRQFAYHTATVNTYLILLVLWWVARNIFHLTN